MPVLHTARLVLVPLDTRQLAARCASRDFHLPFDGPETPGLGMVHFGPDHPGELLDLYPLWLAATLHPGQVLGTWTAICCDDREAVGSLGVKGRPHDDGVEIGYGIVPSHRGRGLATEAVARMCEALLDGEVDLGDEVLQLTAETRTDNHASQHVLRRCGFRQVGERIDERDGPLLCWSR